MGWQDRRRDVSCTFEHYDLGRAPSAKLGCILDGCVDCPYGTVRFPDSRMSYSGSANLAAYLMALPAEASPGARRSPPWPLAQSARAEARDTLR